MAVIFSLVAMILWGMILGLGYQFFVAVIEGKEKVSVRVAYYFFGGLLCFLSTVLFLFVTHGGEWGLYGFLFTVFGFFLYHRFLWMSGKVVSKGGIQFVRSLGAAAVKGVGVLFSAASFPFGKVVDKGAAWVQKRNIKKDKDNDPM